MSGPTPAPTPAPLQQPVMIAAQPTEVPQSVLQTAIEWERRAHSSLFVMSCTRGDAVTFARFFMDKVYAARKQFNNIDKLDLLLDHYGGNLEAAYQLVVGCLSSQSVPNIARVHTRFCQECFYPCRAWR